MYWASFYVFNFYLNEINMNLNTTASRSHLQQLCPADSTIAKCLNQLRDAKISFLNLGNLIICPEQRCYFVFQSKQLMRIEMLDGVL